MLGLVLSKELNKRSLHHLHLHLLFLFLLLFLSPFFFSSLFMDPIAFLFRYLLIFHSHRVLESVEEVTRLEEKEKERKRKRGGGGGDG